jgi:hypothetical protein
MLFCFVFLGRVESDPELERAIPEWMGIFNCFIIISFYCLAAFSK